MVNSAFPDACGPILKTRGLNPTVGIGNVANPVPAIRLGIADQLGIPLSDVKIYLACQHYVSHYIPRFGTAGGAPYYLRAFVGGRDVTKDSGYRQGIFRSAHEVSPNRRTGRADPDGFFCSSHHPGDGRRPAASSCMHPRRTACPAVTRCAWMPTAPRSICPMTVC